MNTLSNILDTLQIDYGKAEVNEVTRAFEFDGSTAQKNILIQLHKGKLFVGKDFLPLKEGEFYFVPAGAPLYARFGKAIKYVSTDVERYNEPEENFSCTHTLSSFEDVSDKGNVFSILQFNTLLHRAVPFFPLLSLPPFSLPADERLSFFLRQLSQEEEQDKIGKTTLLKNYSNEIVIHLFRYLSTQNQFAEYIEKINYLLDSRLVRIIQYIQENLDKDLSNSRLAEVAFLSDDYISQFFKSLTGRNLQDYVEEQRLRKAYELVMTSAESMKEISLLVGFKDPAYFSRRFKMKFETKATAIRKAERVLHTVAA